MASDVILWILVHTGVVIAVVWIKYCYYEQRLRQCRKRRNHNRKDQKISFFVWLWLGCIRHIDSHLFIPFSRLWLQLWLQLPLRHKCELGLRKGSLWSDSYHPLIMAPLAHCWLFSQVYLHDARKNSVNEHKQKILLLKIQQMQYEKCTSTKSLLGITTVKWAITQY